MLHKPATRGATPQLRLQLSTVTVMSTESPRYDRWRQQRSGPLRIASPQSVHNRVNSNEADGSTLPAGGAALRGAAL